MNQDFKDDFVMCSQNILRRHLTYFQTAKMQVEHEPVTNKSCVIMWRHWQ